MQDWLQYRERLPNKEPLTSLVIDRYISREIARPFVSGLGLLTLIFIGYSAALQLQLAAAGKLELLTAFKLVGLNTLVTLEVLMPSALLASYARCRKAVRAGMPWFVVTCPSPLRRGSTGPILGRGEADAT